MCAQAIRSAAEDPECEEWIEITDDMVLVADGAVVVPICATCTHRQIVSGRGDPTRNPNVTPYGIAVPIRNADGRFCQGSAKREHAWHTTLDLEEGTRERQCLHCGYSREVNNVV